MESINIYYAIIVTLIILDIFLIFAIVAGSYKADDDFEYLDENGDHIYYDRKLIKERAKPLNPTTNNESNINRETKCCASDSSDSWRHNK